MSNTPWKYQGQKRGPLNYVFFFVDHPWKFHALYNSLQEIQDAITSTRSHFHVFKPIYWNSLIQEDVWAMTSSEWEMYVAAKLLTNFKHLKGISSFLLILDKEQLTYKISEERRIAIASSVGLDNLSSYLQIIILCLKPIFKYKSP